MDEAVVGGCNNSLPVPRTKLKITKSHWEWSRQRRERIDRNSNWQRSWNLLYQVPRSYFRLEQSAMLNHGTSELRCLLRDKNTEGCVLYKDVRGEWRFYGINLERRSGTSSRTNSVAAPTSILLAKEVSCERLGGLIVSAGWRLRKRDILLTKFRNSWHVQIADTNWTFVHLWLSHKYPPSYTWKYGSFFHWSLC